MIWAILITFVITVLGCLVWGMFHEKMQSQSSMERLQKELDNSRRCLSELRGKDQERMRRDAYNQGLYDGRETDELYRNIIKRHPVMEQYDVAMNGEKGGAKK